MLSKIRNVYQAAALVTLNTVAAFILVNLALWMVFAIRDEHRASVREAHLAGNASPSPVTASGLFRENGTAVDNGKRTQSNLHLFDFKAFEGVMSEFEIAAMLDEYYDHHRLKGFSYQPWTQYGHREFAGKYLNVSKRENGLTARHTVNPPSVFDGEDPIQIFTFGGSTTFGSGVADADTWPSQLSQILNRRSEENALGVPVEVVNYGRVGFYPTQEMHLLMAVLRSGERPELVIFLDGVNLGRADDTANLTPDYHRIIDKAQIGRDMPFSWLPMMRAVRYATAEPEPPDAPTRATAQHAAERFTQFQENVAVISELYQTKPMFILQPDGHHSYPAHLYNIGQRAVDPSHRALKTEFYDAISRNRAFIDMTNLFEKWGDRKAVMDKAHYTPNFSAFLAEEIARQIDLEPLKQRRQQTAAPTGIPRIQ